MKRATVCLRIITLTTIYFNPRPREEGDAKLSEIKELNPTISIHALVKRATAKNEEGRRDINISIHALVKRATT